MANLSFTAPQFRRGKPFCRFNSESLPPPSSSSSSCPPGLRPIRDFRQACSSNLSRLATRRLRVPCRSDGQISRPKQPWHDGFFHRTRQTTSLLHGFLGSSAPAFVPDLLETSALLSSSKTGENRSKKEMAQRRREYAFLLLCAQVVVFNSPLLSLIWNHWPSIIDQLSAGRGRHSFFIPDASEASQQAVLSRVFPAESFHWRTLGLGLILGSLVSIALSNKTVEIGPLIDAAFWLCLLYSMLFFVGCMVRTVVSVGTQISKGGISSWRRKCSFSLMQLTSSLASRLASAGMSNSGSASLPKKRRK